MAKHTIYVYRDFLANVFNALGVLVILMGITMMVQKNLTMGFFFILLGLVLTHKAACRASRIPMRIPAKFAAIGTLILAVLQLADRFLLHSAVFSASISGIAVLLLPLAITVLLLLPTVPNKPVCVAFCLFAYQLLILISVLVDGSLVQIFKRSSSLGYLLLIPMILPLFGGLFMLLRGRKMSPAEKFLFI